MTDETNVDPRNNPESRQAEQDASQLGTRSGKAGPAPTPARPVDGTDADEVAAGTGQGDPLAGLRADPDDIANAVPGDEGPEHHGRR